MSRLIETYFMLISCPSDVLDFLPQIEEAVDSFNRGFGESHSVQINTKHWTKNSFAYLEKGMSGQDVINQQIVEKSDMMVAVFWTRFGTPTEKYGSGTEEEINRMLDSQKPVFLFFLDKPISPSKIDIEQLSRIRKFTDKLSTQKYGLYFIINNESQLTNIFRDQLESHFKNILSDKKNTPASDGGMSRNTLQSWTDELLLKQGDWHRARNTVSVLWVDDRPEDHVYGRKMLESIGIEVIPAFSTNQALMWLEKIEVAVIISDMGCKEGKTDGWFLLDHLRRIGNQTPFIMFTDSKSPEYVAEVEQHGGQGYTSDYLELISMVKSFLLDTYIRPRFPQQ